LLKASETLPFPTGKTIDINEEETYDYTEFLNGPLFVWQENGYIRLNNDSKENIERLSKFIKECNTRGYLPRPTDAT
jgi:hypothetical protein